MGGEKPERRKDALVFENAHSYSGGRTCLSKISFLPNGFFPVLDIRLKVFI
jgi:hypothetical protein